jgi:hypothetical protein
MSEIGKLYVVFTLLECSRCKWPQGLHGHYENDPPSDELLNVRVLPLRCYHCLHEETQTGKQAIQTIVVEWSLETNSPRRIRRM